MGEKCASWLTEAIHFGNDFNSSVASLRPLDAFLRNWWWPSVGIVGGIPRNTHSIEQEQCDRVTIRRESGYLGTITSEKHVLKLDGTVQKDSPWLGSTEQYKTSAKFNDSALQIEARAPAGSTLTMIYSRTPEGDLLEEALINGRCGGSIVAKRQK